MKYFIYYSNSGNGDFLASLYEKAGYQIIKVDTVKPIGKMNFFKMFKLGGEAGMNKCPKINEIAAKWAENDEIVIGSPIWNNRLSTPINTLLRDYKFNKETTKFVLYPAGSSGKNAIQRLQKKGFTQTPLVIVAPLNNKEAAEKALEL